MNDPATPVSGAPPLTRRDLEAKIIAKAWRDPAYKKQLTDSPRVALQDELSAIDPSIVLPAALQVHVHEETPNVYHLVLPRNPRDISLGEVLGDHLETVAPQTFAVIISVVNTNVVNSVQTVVGNVNTNVVGNVATNVIGINNVNAQTVGNIVVVGNVAVVAGPTGAVVSNAGAASSWATIAASVTLTNSMANSVA